MSYSLAKNKEYGLESRITIHHHEHHYPTSLNTNQRIINQLHKTTTTSSRSTGQNISKHITLAHRTTLTIDRTTQSSTKKTNRINGKKIFRWTGKEKFSHSTVSASKIIITTENRRNIIVN